MIREMNEKAPKEEEMSVQRMFSNRDLRKLIIPIIIEQFLLIFVGLMDSVMVASVGEAAVSAVSLIDNIMVLIINVFTALGMGGAIVAGQFLGGQEREQGCRAIEQTVLFCTVASVGVMVLMYLGKWFILHVVFGKITAEVMGNCNTYLLIVSASIPFIALYNAGAAAFRIMGDSRTPMLMSLLSNGMNVVGNAILIYGLHMGVEGAAIPTLVARAFAGIVVLVLLCNQKKALHIRKLTKIRLSLPMQKKILRIGIPYGIENSMFQLGKIVVLSLVSGFGTAAIAANAVSATVVMVAILGGISMGYALSTVASRCVGAGDYEQVRYYTKKMIGWAYVINGIFNVAIMMALPLILRVYHLSAGTSHLAWQMIMFHSVMAILIWVPGFVISNTLRAANDASFCMGAASVSMWLVRVGGAYLLCTFTDVGVFGVWIAMISDWVVRATLFIWRYRGDRWQRG